MGKRLVDAQELDNSLSLYQQHFRNCPRTLDEDLMFKVGDSTVSKCREYLANQPTVDVVEPCYCRECKFFRAYIDSKNGYCGHSKGLVKPFLDDFCSYAERKKEAGIMAAEYIAKDSVLEMAYRESDGCGGEYLAVTVDDVKAIPAADVAPVIHGNWEKKEFKSLIPVEYDFTGELVHHTYIEYCCDQCGRRVSNKEPYCHCGAKMDVGEEQ